LSTSAKNKSNFGSPGPPLDAQRPVSRAEAGMPRQLLRDSLGVRARRGDIP
jgi:hypothetical protein